MQTLDIHRVKPGRLAQLFDPGLALADCWDASELAAVLRHQLRAPVVFDLGTLGETAQARLQKVFETRRKPGLSFGELLHAPKPSVRLLKLTKQFAKAHRAHPESPLPVEVAAVLYFATILVARLRRRRRISDLHDADLRRGLRWTIRQPWVDEETRNLCQEGLRYLDA